jgi:hypothetical protein
LSAKWRKKVRSQEIVDAPGCFDGLGGVGDAFDTADGVREDRDVDACRIHLLDATGAQVAESFADRVGELRVEAAVARSFPRELAGEAVAEVRLGRGAGPRSVPRWRSCAVPAPSSSACRRREVA